MANLIVDQQQELSPVDELFGIGTTPEADRRGHSGLQVGATDHRKISPPAPTVCQDGGKITHFRRQNQQSLPEPEADRGSGLIVTRPSGVNPLSGLSEAFG